MNDPLSPLTSQPPRYLLESDSSDEEGQGQYPLAESSSRKSKVTPKIPVVDIRYPRSQGKDEEEGKEKEVVIIGVGQAGRYLARRAGITGNTEVELEISVDGLVIGRGYGTDEGMLVVVEDEGVEGLFEVSEMMLKSIKAKAWLVVTTYLPSMYIPDFSSENPQSYDDAPIRYLSSEPTANGAPSADGGAVYESPNYVTGLPAALLSLATHPSSPLPPKTNLILVNLPLPLSSIPGKSIMEMSSGLGKGVWREEDDEPYSGIGMGAGRKKGAGKREEEGVGMYT